MLDRTEELKRHAAESPKAQVKAAINTIIGGAHRASNSPDERPLTARAKKVIDLAVSEAQRMGHPYIGTEHLLLGILSEREGAAAEVLIEKCGLQLHAVRNLIAHMLQETHTATLPEIPEQALALLGEQEQGITCKRCGARSPDYFRYCFHCGLQFPFNVADQM